jgi:hypothetical protein
MQQVTFRTLIVLVDAPDVSLSHYSGKRAFPKNAYSSQAISMQSFFLLPSEAVKDSDHLY